MTSSRAHGERIWRGWTALGAALSLMAVLQGCATGTGGRATGPAPAASTPAPPAEPATPPAPGRAEDKPRVPVMPVPPSGTPVPVAPRAAAQALPATAARTISFNFDNADVPSVVQTLARLLGINYILEPTVGPGRVTINASGKFAKEELFPILETVLEVNNLAITKSGPLYRIGPLAESKQRPLEAYVGRQATASGDKVIIQVIPLSFLPASGLEAVLKPLVSKTGTFLPVPGTNSLVLVDLASSVKNVVDLIELLDVNTFDRIQVKLYPVTNVAAEELATELEDLFTQLGYGRATREPLRFLPIPRLGTILVVNAFPELTPAIDRWIQALDQPTTQAEEGIFVYYVENGKATNIADILNSLYQRKSETQPAAAAARPPARAGAPGAGGGARTSPTSTYTPPGARAQSEARPLGGGAGGVPTAAAPPAPAAAGGGGGFQAVLGGPPAAAAPPAAGAPKPVEVRVLADEATNALIIAAPPRQYPAILETIKKLDIPKKQVVIETLVAELTLDDSTTFGLEWSLRTSGKVRIGGKDYFVNTTPTANFGNLFSPQSSLLGFSSVFTVTDQILGLIRALADATRINVLSSPNILVTDNKTAVINIGDSVPILTSQTSTAQLSGGQANVTNTIQYQDTGIILEVTAHINEKRLVVFDIKQEVSNVSPNTIRGIDSPIIQKRTANTSAVVADGQTVLIGGLITEERSQIRTGIPGLSKIPILGYLFGSTTDATKKRELIILITPRVIGEPDDARSITTQFEERIKGLKQQMRQFRSPEP